MDLFILPDFGGPTGTGASLQITLMMILAGGTAKNLVKLQWRWREYYLGMDLAFSAIASVLVGLATGHEPNPRELGTFLGWSISLLMLIMALHRGVGDLEEKYVLRFFVLGVFANALGAVLIFISVVRFGA